MDLGAHLAKEPVEVPLVHWDRRPAIAESRAVQAAIELSKSFSITPNICHLSTADGMEHIRQARKQGLEKTSKVETRYPKIKIEKEN